MHTVVDTTQEAEFDFAIYQIDETTREEIGKQLKSVPRSVSDRVIGDLRIRTIGEWDVMFAISADKEQWVISIAGLAPEKQLETTLEHLWRCLRHSLPASIRVLLEGRKRK